jgi:uroporphyrinogen-III synthase
VRVLITRPEEDAGQMAAALRERGHEPILSPLMEIRFLDGPEILLDGIQAVLATSANGVRALARRTPRRDVPVFAVGPQTAAAAEAAGFVDIKNAQSNALALADAAARWSTPQAGALLHVAGRERVRHLAAALAERGFEVRVEVLYEALEAWALSKDSAEALASGRLDAVMLFSPRSARIFSDRVREAKLEGGCGRMTAVCISQATADAVAALSFAAVRVAAKPNQESMLDLLDQG